MCNPIDLYLISGFLGAGKTTFLKSLMESFDHNRLGVLVNEFGSIGVDGAVIQKDGLRLVEINNGSIFCACIKDGFVRTLKAFTQQPIDTLLIECSGMADPAGMNAMLEGLAPYLERPYQYRGCVCLVDCTTFLDYIDVLMPLQGQVAAADLVLVNKTDLADSQTLAEIRHQIRQLNQTAPIHNTSYARIPQQLLENELINRGFSGAGSNSVYNRPATYTVQTDAVLSEAGVRSFHKALDGKALRFKGFVRSREGWLHVDGVAGQLEISAATFKDAPPPTGRLVLIAADDVDLEKDIRDAYEASCPGAIEIQAT